MQYETSADGLPISFGEAIRLAIDQQQAEWREAMLAVKDHLSGMSSIMRRCLGPIPSSTAAGDIAPAKKAAPTTAALEPSNPEDRPITGGLVAKRQAQIIEALKALAAEGLLTPETQQKQMQSLVLDRVGLSKQFGARGYSIDTIARLRRQAQSSNPQIRKNPICRIASVT
jgi:hypothetical protein